MLGAASLDDDDFPAAHLSGNLQNFIDPAEIAEDHGVEGLLHPMQVGAEDLHILRQRPAFCRRDGDFRAVNGCHLCAVGGQFTSQSRQTAAGVADMSVLRQIGQQDLCQLSIEIAVFRGVGHEAYRLCRPELHYFSALH